MRTQPLMLPMPHTSQWVDRLSTDVHHYGMDMRALLTLDWNSELHLTQESIPA